MAHYVCCTGGRDYSDRENVLQVVTALAVFYGSELRAMDGAARGADTLFHEAAVSLGVKCKRFPADWDAHPKAAGHIRNQEMVDYLVMCRSKGHSVQVVAFPGGNGTANMIERAERAGIDVDRF
jgi:hypothetical protein